MFPILWILKLCGVGDGLQKILAPVIAVAVVAAAVWAFYGYAKHEGAKPYIAEIAVFKAQIEANERLTKLAQKNMQEGQETIVKELKEKLAASEAKKQKTLTIKVMNMLLTKPTLIALSLMVLCSCSTTPSAPKSQLPPFPPVAPEMLMKRPALKSLTLPAPSETTTPNASKEGK